MMRTQQAQGRCDAYKSEEEDFKFTLIMCLSGGKYIHHVCWALNTQTVHCIVDLL